MGHSLESLKKQVKIAREQAYIGLYSDSLRSMVTAIETVKKHSNGLKDEFLYAEWKRVATELLAEMSIVQELQNMIDGVKNDELKKPTTSGGRMEIEPPRNAPNPANERPLPNKAERKLQHFNQAPFQHHSKSKEELDNPPEDDYNNYEDPSNSNQRNIPNHQVYLKPQQQPRNQNQYQNQYQAPPAPPKDPDVWDPPSPTNGGRWPKAPPRQNNGGGGGGGFNYIDKARQGANKPGPQKGKPTNSNQGAGAKKGDDKRKNYDKPWQANAAGQQGPDKSGGDPTLNPDGSKKTYLQFVYGESESGPDHDLISMLEKEVLDKCPKVSFEDIAELDAAKNTLQEAVILPLLMPDFFKGIRRPWKGVLMYGPPGTGKTMLAKAFATLGKTTFFSVSASSLASKWKGESEKLVRILFDMARYYAPSTVFFDEIDSLASKRSDGEGDSSRKVKAELLVQMDGVSVVSSASAGEKTEQEQRKQVMVLAATNRPWDLDEALRRRLEKRIYIPLPSEGGRRELFRINLNGVKVDEVVDFEALVSKTDGYSGNDIANLCRDAALMPMRKKLLKEGGFKNFTNMGNIQDLQAQLDIPISQNDFQEALKNIQKSVGKEDLKAFEQFMSEFGST